MKKLSQLLVTPGVVLPGTSSGIARTATSAPLADHSKARTAAPRWAAIARGVGAAGVALSAGTDSPRRRRLEMEMNRFRTSRGPGARAVGAALAIAFLATVGTSASADPALETRQLVEKATFTIENFAAGPSMAAFRRLVKRAKGVFIAPELLKAAFVVGASGGSGLLLVREERAGRWQGPAFYTLGGASFGLQIGAEASEMVVLAMTERGVTAMLQPSVKLGAEVNLAVGPVGAGVEAATENLSADLLVFSRSKGLYGGVSLQGAVLAIRHEWNRAYYGRSVTPTDILVRGDAGNREAARLLTTLTKVAEST